MQNKKKLANEVLGEDEDFNCSEVADLSSNDYASCEITFDAEGNATVTITGKGKFSGYTCSGTKNNVTCDGSNTNVNACLNREATPTYTLNTGIDVDECIDAFESSYINVGEFDNTEANEYATAICNNSPDASSLLVTGLNERFISYNDVSEFVLKENKCVSSTELAEVCTSGASVSGYYLRDDVDVSACTNTLTVLYNEAWGEYESNRDLAEAICSNDDEWVDSEYWAGDGTHNVSDTIVDCILYDNYTYEDIKEFFGKEYECRINYIKHYWLTTSLSYNYNLVKFYSDGGLEVADEINDVEPIDISEARDENILLYEVYDDENDEYNAYIVSNDVIYFPKDSSHMFETYGGFPILELDFNHSINTSKVTDMNGMFSYFDVIALDLSDFDTSNVTNMSEMFRECKNLTSLDVSHFDTSKVTTMEAMFERCYTLSELDISNFNTSSVTDISSMFFACNSLEELDLSSFDTNKVQYMYSMFGGCDNLGNIYVGKNWTTSSVISSGDMFGSDYSSKCVNLPNFDSSKLDATMAYVGGYLECKSGLTCTCTYSGC